MAFIVVYIDPFVASQSQHFVPVRCLYNRINGLNIANGRVLDFIRHVDWCITVGCNMISWGKVEGEDRVPEIGQIGQLKA